MTEMPSRRAASPTVCSPAKTSKIVAARCCATERVSRPSVAGGGCSGPRAGRLAFVAGPGLTRPSDAPARRSSGAGGAPEVALLMTHLPAPVGCQLTTLPAAMEPEKHAALPPAAPSPVSSDQAPAEPHRPAPRPPAAASHRGTAAPAAAQRWRRRATPQPLAPLDGLGGVPPGDVSSISSRLDPAGATPDARLPHAR